MAQNFTGINSNKEIELQPKVVAAVDLDEEEEAENLREASANNCMQTLIDSTT